MSNVQNVMTRPCGNVRPSSVIAERVRAFVAQHGERTACEFFGLSRIAIARAGAGMSCRGATLFVLEEGLRRADEQSSAAE